jgi:GAF domain-containing protein
MIGWCIANQQARIALDVGEDAVRFENPLLPETRSEMALPLVSRGYVIGAMTIQSDQPAAFTQEDVTVLQTMADQLANAVENAQLLEQAQARARHEQILREVTARVRGSTDPDTVMRTLARELGTVLDRPTFVRLGSAEELSQAPMTQSTRGTGDQPSAEGGK